MHIFMSFTFTLNSQYFHLDCEGKPEDVHSYVDEKKGLPIPNQDLLTVKAGVPLSTFKCKSSCKWRYSPNESKQHMRFSGSTEKTTRNILKRTQRVHITEMQYIHYAQGRRCHRKYGNKTVEQEVEEGEISTYATAGVSSKTSRGRGSIHDQKSERERVSLLDC